MTLMMTRMLVVYDQSIELESNVVMMIMVMMMMTMMTKMMLMTMLTVCDRRIEFESKLTCFCFRSSRDTSESFTYNVGVNRIQWRIGSCNFRLDIFFVQM